MKKILLLILLFPSAAFARNGTVFVIDKIAPKNGAFTGVVDSSQAVTNVTNFNGNLSSADTDVQKALDTLDNMSVSGGGGASTLAIKQNGVSVSSPTSVINFVSPMLASFLAGTTAQVTIDTTTSNGVLSRTSNYVSSLTVTSALTLGGTNNVAGAVPIIGVNFSSVVSQGDLSAYMTQSSSTLNDLKLSSASVTYLNRLSPYVSSVTAGTGISITGSASAPIINTSGSGGGSALAVSTGSPTVYSAPPTVSAATAVIFDSNTFTSQLITGTSVFIGINSAVVGGSNGTIFAMTTSSTVVNSSAETNIIGAGSGVITLPANYLQTGKTLRVKASGLYTSTTTAGVLTVKFKLGSTVILSSASFPLVDNQTNQFWSFGIALTCRSAGATGTVQGNTSFGMFDTTNGYRNFPMTSTTTSTIDTTASQQISLTVQFGTANSSNTITNTNFVVAGETVTTIGGIAGSGYALEPATAPAVGFNLGFYTSTAVINGATALGITSGASRATLRVAGIVAIQNLNTYAPDSAGVFLAAASTGTTPDFYTARRASGTVASPVATGAGLNLLQISAGGYGATGWAPSSTGKIDFVSDEAFTDSSQATSLRFATTPSGSTATVTRVTLAGNGALTVASSATFQAPVTFSSNTIGTFDLTFDACQAKFPGSNSPSISNSTNEISCSIYFDDTSTQSVTYAGLVTHYDGRPLYADIIFTSTGTSGTVNWGVYTSTQTPNLTTTNYDSGVFNVLVTTSVTTSSNANALQIATVALSNTTTANGQMVTFKLEREAGLSDTAVGFGRVKKLRIYE